MVTTAKLTQNDKDFFVGAMDSDMIMRFADVPFLNFDQDLKSFCEYTAKSASSPPHKPSLWQRPLDDGRVDKIGSWLDANSSRCIPDAVILGERAETRRTEPVIDLLPSAGPGGTQYVLTITNQLKDGCPNCGPYLDDDDNPVFQNRCGDCDCQHHMDSTNPLQIIDGQHRLHGLHSSAIGSKDVAVIFLLMQRRETDKYPAIRGFTADAQAEIFRQVNTESEALDVLHQKWLKRFFDERWSSTPTPPQNPPDERLAFDALMDLGGPGLGATGRTNPWENKVKGHPKARAREYMDTLRGAEDKFGEPGAITQIIRHLEGSNLTRSQLLQNYIQGSINAITPVWVVSGPGLAPFQHRRLFEAVVLLFPRIKKWADEMNLTGYSVGDFEQVWALHEQEFTTGSADDWKQFTSGGEPAPKQFRKTLELMWHEPPSPYNGQSPRSKPLWETRMGIPGDQDECPDWKTYVTLQPDPIKWLDPPTLFASDSHHSRDSAQHDTAATLTPGDNLRWEEPRNVGQDADVDFREPSGPWIELGGKGFTREFPDGILGSGSQFQIRVKYKNICGYTELIAEFEVA